MNLNLSHYSALVIIPSSDVWPAIQSIRQRHDSKVKRWMPHITLVYPFIAVEQFDTIAEPIRQACETISPFEVSLSAFKSFRHRRGKHTVWLDPQPNDAVEELRAMISRSIAGFSQQFTKLPRRFRPHLSVGQCQGHEQLSQLVDQLQSEWKPVSFEVSKVSLIWRNDPNDDVFRVETEIDLRV